ncbi:MAG: hypothetical protein ACFFEF_06445 [Candidatus Thorarchaeota archaeon]
MSILSDIMMKTAKPGTEELGKVKDRMDAIQRVVGLLMVYQVIFPGYFGSDDDFVDLALKVFYEMLRT